MNWTDFWQMGGYGLYVWSSFGVTALLMVGELVLLGRQRAQVLKRLRHIRDIETA